MRYPNIEEERKVRGIKRGEVARALGVSRDTYNAWINGDYPIPSNFVFLLCGMFRCSSDYLLASDGRHERWKQYCCLNDFERGVLCPACT